MSKGIRLKTDGRDKDEIRAVFPVAGGLAFPFFGLVRLDDRDTSSARFVQERVHDGAGPFEALQTSPSQGRRHVGVSLAHRLGAHEEIRKQRVFAGTYVLCLLDSASVVARIPLSPPVVLQLDFGLLCAACRRVVRVGNVLRLALTYIPVFIKSPARVSFGDFFGPRRYANTR